MASDLAVRAGAAKGKPVELTLWPGLTPPLMADTVRAMWTDRGKGRLAWVSASDEEAAAALADALNFGLDEDDPLRVELRSEEG